MYTHVVLLRGVNVGKAKRIPMATLKELLHELGCEEVKTLLNSGNAVVSRPAVLPTTLAREIGDAIRSAFGFDVPVVVKSVRDFRAIVASNTLLPDPAHHSRFLVAFTQTDTALRELGTITKVVRPPDRFLLGRKAAYLHCPNGILESAAAETLLGKAGNAITTRNWATVLKLHDLSRTHQP